MPFRSPIYKSFPPDLQAKLEMSGVYFVKNNINSLTKIGRAVNFKSRLTNVFSRIKKRYEKLDVEVINLVVVRDLKALDQKEKYFHKKYSDSWRYDKRTGESEWFQLSDEELEEIRLTGSSLSQF